jgi:hypothetical protein
MSAAFRLPPDCYNAQSVADKVQVGDRSLTAQKEAEELCYED